MDSSIIGQEQAEKIGYRDILSQKQFMKIIFADVISRFGDSIDAIAFTWLIYTVTGSAAWSAVIFAVNQIPTVLLQPFAGVLVDGMHKKKVMVYADLIRGITIVTVAGLYLLKMINPWILVMMTLLISSAEAFCMPASTSIMPKILDRKYYAFGSSMNASLCMVFQIIGMGAAGVIIAFGGVGLAMLIDAGTFFASALITGTVKVQENPGKKAVDLHGFFDQMKAGADYIRSKRAVLNFCLLGLMLNAVLVPLNALQSPMAVEIYGQGSAVLSVFGVALMLGIASGSVVMPYLMQKVTILRMVILSGVGIGCGIAGISFGGITKGNVIAAYALCAGTSYLIGISCGCLQTVVGVQFMKTVQEEYLARASSIFNATATLATPVTSLIVSIAATVFPVAVIFRIFAVICLIVIAVAGIRKIELS